jgi:hypothetical protein
MIESIRSMDIFGSLPEWALWAALVAAMLLISFSMRFLTATLKTGQVILFGRLIADRTKSPALFWTLFSDGVLVGGFCGFVLISVLVELFLVRA